MSDHLNSIAEVMVPLPLEGPFDYAVPMVFQKNIEAGQRVEILFNRRKMLGFVVKLKQESEFKKLNPIVALLDKQAVFDSAILKLALETSSYFGCSEGEILEGALPRALRKRKLNEEMWSVRNLKQNTSKNKELIFDSEGVKKWEYLEKQIKTAIDNKESVLFLVPEKEGVAFAVKQLSAITEVLIYKWDSKLTPKKEFEVWLNIRQGKPCIVVGTRSAVWLPLWNLGLIILHDEEAETYKQEQPPHYHARTVSQLRSKIEGTRLILTSMLPTIDSYYEASKERIQLHEFKDENTPGIQLVDTSNYKGGRAQTISYPIQNALFQDLEKGKKFLLILNRKGFGTLTHCQQCGYASKCPRCDINLTYRSSVNMLICSRCDHKEAVVKQCPNCKGAYMRSIGMGIERIENDFIKFYPHAKIGRFDKDSKTFPKNAQVLIATTAIFRYREKWKADVVAVLDFDSMLYQGSYESTYQAMLTLMYARSLAKERLIVQTRMPENECLRSLQHAEFHAFYDREIASRKEWNYPPFKHLVLVHFRGEKEEKVLEASSMLSEILRTNAPQDIEVSEPFHAKTAKLRDKFRYDIMIKGKNIDGILKLIKVCIKQSKRKQGVIVTIEVDG